MKIVLGSIVTAVAASACCLGPVVFSALGAGALGAAAVRFEPYRPVFLALTGALLIAAFYTTYRSREDEVCADGTCRPASRRAARVVVWIAALIVLLLVTFPYYVEYLV